jgi:hypothetical protein
LVFLVEEKEEEEEGEDHKKEQCLEKYRGVGGILLSQGRGKDKGPIEKRIEDERHHHRHFYSCQWN